MLCEFEARFKTLKDKEKQITSAFLHGNTQGDNLAKKLKTNDLSSKVSETKSQDAHKEEEEYIHVIELFGDPDDATDDDIIEYLEKLNRNPHSDENRMEIFFWKQELTQRSIDANAWYFETVNPDYEPPNLV